MTDPTDQPIHHGRELYAIEGETSVDTGTRAIARLVAADAPATEEAARVAAEAAAPPFRFSRLGPKGPSVPQPLRAKLARAMTHTETRSGGIPAGFTYLGQFVDHDLTFDRTSVMFGATVSPSDLLQGRSPTLDLDSLYGAGPTDAASAVFYGDDRHLNVGATVAIGGDRARTGFDVPRRGKGRSRAAKRRAMIPDLRNDENLAVAQVHAAMIRFHNRVVDTLARSTPPAQRFSTARRRVVRHYQWMLRTDYLPRICDPAVVDDVFRNGRRVVEPDAGPLDMPAMPVEFSVAAFRLGHSMIRDTYSWNARFPSGQGSLDLLFAFSGTSGDLGGDLKLPSNWIADWRRLFEFSRIGHRELAAPRGEFNRAQQLDTHMVDPLAVLPVGSFGGGNDDVGTMRTNLAFRNLTRASMLNLATGQQMVRLLRSRGAAVTALTRAQIREGNGGASLSGLTSDQRRTVVEATPLWFYVLREAELNGGRLGGVGARIVAETFHRAMSASRSSIVRSPEWRPFLGEVDGRFLMTDLLFFAFEGKKSLLAPLGD